jgi:hypothetical protein
LLAAMSENDSQTVVVGQEINGDAFCLFVVSTVRASGEGFLGSDYAAVDERRCRRSREPVPEHTCEHVVVSTLAF